MSCAAIADKDGLPIVPLAALLVALFVVLVTALALQNLTRIVRAIAPIDEEASVAWTFSHVLLVAFVFVASMLVVPTLLPLPREGAWLLVISSTSMLPPIALATGFAWVLDPRRLRALGIRAGYLFRAPIAGIVAYVGVVLGLYSTGIVWQWILARFGVADVEQDVIAVLRDLVGTQRLLAVVFGVVIQPLLEEFLFRGFLQPFFVQHLRPVAGVAVTSAIFAAIHGVGAFVPIFALSCLLGFVMMRTHRLHAVWAIHALHNGSQFLYLYVLSGVLDHTTPAGGLFTHFIR